MVLSGAEGDKKRRRISSVGLGGYSAVMRLRANEAGGGCDGSSSQWIISKTVGAQAGTPSGVRVEEATALLACFRELRR